MIRETGALYRFRFSRGKRKNKGNVRDKRKRLLSKFGFKKGQKYMENDCKLEREKDFSSKPKRNDIKSLEETRLY